MISNQRSKDIIKKIESKFKVLKRDGRTEDFVASKVSSAISRALINGGGWAQDEETAKYIEKVTVSVCSLIVKTGIDPVPVDDVQKFVIQQFWMDNMDRIATHYTLYKEERRKAREADPIKQEVRDMVAADAKHFGEPIQYFQLITKFARWNEEAKRRETWEEVCNRVISWFKRQPKLANIEGYYWIELYSYLYNLQASPAMRVIQMAGPPLDRCNVGVFNCSYLPFNDIFSFAELLYILMQGTGAGFSVESYNIEHLPRIKRQKAGDKAKVIIDDSTEGWCDALHTGLKTWFEGDDIDFDFSKIRPAGARLITKGGRSCGPEPLKDLLKFAKELITKRQGKYLTELDCHDLGCMIGKIVQVGGVRRAALISLSDLGSNEMREAKSGAWWQNHVHRSMANNSAVYDKKPSDTVFMEEWLSLAKSGSGERGIFNRDGVIRMLPKRRKKARFGTNPCFHPDTRIHTARGMVRIVDMYNDGAEYWKVVVDNRAEFKDTSLGVTRKAASRVEMTQSDVQVYKLVTDHGHEILCTDNHEFPTNRGRLQLKDMRPGDQLMLQSEEGYFGRYGGYGEGLLTGLATGCGQITGDSVKQSISIEDFFDDANSFSAMVDCQKALARRTTSGNMKLTNPKTANSIKMSGPVFSSKIKSFAGIADLPALKKGVSEAIMTGTRGMAVGYLCGLMTAAGKVVRNSNGSGSTLSLQIESTSHKLMLDVQVMLGNFGVVSRVKKVIKRPDSALPIIDERAQVSDHERYNLTINHANCLTFMDNVGLEGYIGATMVDLMGGGLEGWWSDESYLTTVKEISEHSISDVYCINQPDGHNVIANGVVAGNCAEIILRPNQFCNLSIVVARPDDTAQTLKEKIRVATIFGTMQASCTNFKYIRKEWAKNCEEEALLGVDITGQMDCPLLRPGAPGRDRLLEELKAIVAETNEAWAKKIGINRAAADTCVKPSGDSSQFFNCGSGIHAWFGKFFIRRVRERKDSPVTRMLMDQGVPWIVAPEDPSLVCFEFPRKAPEGALTRHDQTAIDQLDNWLVWKKHFAEHSVSATVYIEDTEWFEAGLWVHKHFDEVSGVSFLPRDNGSYTGTPYEEIAEDEYRKRLALLPEIDWSKLVRYETEDMTTGSQEFACVAGSCER